MVKDLNIEPSNNPIPFNNILPTPVPEAPQPVVPFPEPGTPIKPSFAFSFYGMPCTVELEHHRFALAGVDENEVANAWNLLLSEYLSLCYLRVLLTARQVASLQLGLCPLSRTDDDRIFPADKLNEIRLLQMYILTQSGYKVRIACADNRLVLLLTSKDNMSI